VSVLKLKLAFVIDAEIETPLQVNDSKVIFNVPSGKLLEAETGKEIAELVSPSGDWLEIQPSGTMNLNIRDAFKLDDGHNLLATVTGRSVPNEVVGPKMENGMPVSGDEMYFILSLLMETSSEKYWWVNDCVFIGQMDELIMPSEKAGRIRYNVFCVEYEIPDLKI
tara:strand:+ start:256 stop:753 length:498 start_codon:yes stop_codon:yes gene_type:complete